MLRLRLLGELEVSRDGERLALPPSRKTRALLGFLAATGRTHRRERLCSMFWEIPDDPRGSLRWSMSRLRSIVDEPMAPRILANRESVGFDPQGADIDLGSLRAAAARGFDEVETETLAELAGSFRGEFLEGLELPGQHEFQAWCLAEREDLRQLQIRLLTVLAHRQAEAGEPAIGPWRQLTQIDPYNEAARLALLKALIAAGREPEAERQFEAAERQFRELGGDTAARFTQQWRTLRTRPVPSPEPVAETPVLTAPRPQPRAPAPQPTLGRLGLVGRDAEQHRLAAALDVATRLGEGGVVLILGENGTGKSRMIAELCARAEADGIRVFSGRAYDGALGAAYTPWIEALTRLPELGGAESLVVGREQLFAAVTAEVIGDGTPVLVALDDVHWSDEASADLLHQLVRSSRHAPLLVVLGAREGDLPDNAAMSAVLRSLRHDGLVDELHLGPLAPAETAALIAAIAPAEEAQRIVELSGGNPLFAIELARDLDQCDDTLPTSLRELLVERLERLPPQGAELVRWAAVLGSPFSATRLQAVAGLPSMDFLQSLDLLERHGMLRVTGEDEYRFSHDLVRPAVLTTLSTPRRKLMHLRVAEALRAEEGGEALALELATHAAQGGNNSMAARACVDAGRRALRVFAHVEAMAMVRAGFHYAEQLKDAERVERLVELIDIEVSADRNVDAPALMARLDELAEAALDFGRPQVASRCYTILAHMRWQSGEWRGAERDMLQAEFVSRVTAVEQRVVAMAEAARCLAMLERDMEQAEAMVLEAEALGRRIPLEPNAIPDALGLLRAHQGSFEEAERYFRQARDIARRDGDRLNEFLVLEHHVTLEIANDRLEAAASLCPGLLELARKVRPGSELAFAEALAAVFEFRGGAKGADHRIAAALDALRGADAKHRLAVAATAASRAFLARGDLDRAARTANEALDNAERMDRASDVAEALSVLVEIEAQGAGRRPSLYLERLNQVAAAEVSASARAASERALIAASSRNAARA